MITITPKAIKHIRSYLDRNPSYERRVRLTPIEANNEYFQTIIFCSWDEPGDIVTVIDGDIEFVYNKRDDDVLGNAIVVCTSDGLNVLTQHHYLEAYRMENAEVPAPKTKTVRPDYAGLAMFWFYGLCFVSLGILIATRDTWGGLYMAAVGLLLIVMVTVMEWKRIKCEV
jgi:hypothetical protein